MIVNINEREFGFLLNDAPPLPMWMADHILRSPSSYQADVPVRP